MNPMKSRTVLIYLMLIFVFAVSSCGVVNKNNCGCPAKKGFIGY